VNDELNLFESTNPLLYSKGLSKSAKNPSPECSPELELMTFRTRSRGVIR
jgi:hypothetical protein